MSLISVLAAAEPLAPLIMPNWAFPLIAAIIFAFLGIVTWSFRDVANRHSHRIQGSSSEPTHH